MSIRRIAVLMTSFNRRTLTLRSLASLFRQRNAQGIQLSVLLMEDGCTDGTGDAVKERFPAVNVLHGDGTLFWNGGMRVAFDAALRESYDAYMFLNDDVILYEDALDRMIHCAVTCLTQGSPAIVVGSTLSRDTGEHSYGGIKKRANGFRLVLEKVKPHAFKPITCDTMNGNCVLVPQQIADGVGNIEARFRHQFGDLDYGFRARRAGFDIVVAPGYYGECAPNSRVGTWRDSGTPLAGRWKSLMSPKGVPLREWLLFTRRHYGWRWVYYAVSPYLKTFISCLFAGKVVHNLNDAALPKP